MKIAGVKMIGANQATLISPNIAKALMKHNTNNRKPSQVQIRRIKQEIEKGQFYLTTDAIGFNKAGEMVNGQNRCMACVEANKPIMAFVVCGLDNDVYTVTDAQKVRTLADRMRIIRSTAEIVNQYAKNILGMPGRISAKDGQKIYDSTWDSFDFAASMRPKVKGIGVASVWVAITEYHKVAPEKAQEFAVDFVGISEIRHCNVLKNWLMTKTKYAGGVMQKEIAHRALYCMDAHYRDVAIERIGKIAPADAFKDVV